MSEITYKNVFHTTESNNLYSKPTYTKDRSLALLYMGFIIFEHSSTCFHVVQGESLRCIAMRDTVKSAKAFVDSVSLKVGTFYSILHKRKAKLFKFNGVDKDGTYIFVKRTKGGKVYYKVEGQNLKYLQVQEFLIF